MFRRKERKEGKNSQITGFPQGHYIFEQDVSGRASFGLAFDLASLCIEKDGILIFIFPDAEHWHSIFH